MWSPPGLLEETAALLGSTVPHLDYSSRHYAPRTVEESSIGSEMNEDGARHPCQQCGRCRRRAAGGCADDAMMRDISDKCPGADGADARSYALVDGRQALARRQYGFDLRRHRISPVYLLFRNEIRTAWFLDRAAPRMEAKGIGVTYAAPRATRDRRGRCVRRTYSKTKMNMDPVPTRSREQIWRRGHCAGARLCLRASTRTDLRPDPAALSENHRLVAIRQTHLRN